MEFIICKRALHVEVLFLFFSCFASKCNFTLDTITSSHPITDPETIVSTNKTFELGFFSPPNTSNRYVGIWFSNVRVRSVVWVANREKPLNDSSGTITISEEGNLVVLNGQKDIIWSSNVSNSMVNSSARLLNTGNLVLQDGSDVKMLWQSFQHPSESLLQQMKLSSDQSTGEKVVLKSWRSPSDPSVGNFSAGVDLQTVPQLTVWNGNYKYWRSGPWDNQVFTGVESMTSTYQSRVIVDDDNEGSVTMSFTFVEGMTSFFRLNPDGSLVQIYWAEEKQDWEVTWSSLETECGVYGKCGPFGSCNSRTPQICTCLPGFEPAHEDAWKRGNFSGGCVRRLLLQCEGNGTGKKDGFQKLTTMKLPDFQELSDVPENKCESQCVNYCSCAAYTYLNGIGCMIWKGNLIDLQKFDNGGADLYIRLASSELDNERKKRTVIAISVSIGSIIMTMCAYFTWMRLVNHRGMEKLRKVPLFRNYSEFQENSTEVIQEITARDVKLKELPLCKFEELALATGNFNLTNKLGQGGFGPVYNGKFPNGQEIAVKRLSRSSGQGLEEFMNEVVVISKLQHRNLVRLLGCCIEGEEKMLIYEYMPNGSLDAFLFEPSKQVLDWNKRFNIIEGIGRGLLYLHRDSRLRIIHRDLKASNILLDEELNPKISDFGMARIFGSKENQANTKRVVGTYGYMAPEYAMQGRFSEKSDVFSFGVLLIEIVSGKRNTGFYNNEQALSLLGLAWRLWNEDKIVTFIDQRISYQGFESQILRCLHVGLLCVQDFAADRPTTSKVLSMLSSETSALPTPNQPAFTERHASSRTSSSEPSHQRCSVNDVTVTVLRGR